MWDKLSLKLFRDKAKEIRARRKKAQGILIPISQRQMAWLQNSGAEDEVPVLKQADDTGNLVTLSEKQFDTLMDEIRAGRSTQDYKDKAKEKEKAINALGSLLNAAIRDAKSLPDNEIVIQWRNREAEVVRKYINSS